MTQASALSLALCTKGVDAVLLDLTVPLVEKIMFVRFLNPSFVIFQAAVQIFGFNSSALAAPKIKESASHTPKSITFYPPIAAAKTIQVHEVLSEAQKSEQGLGRLLQTASLTIRLQSAYNPSTQLDESRYRIDITESNPPEPASYTIYDGKKELVVKRGKVVAHETTEELNDKWAVSLGDFIGTLFDYHQHTQDAVTAVLARREGRQVLVHNELGQSETWYDPKTHLPLRSSQLVSQFGVTVELSRTVYSGWILNAPLPVSTFAFPTGIPIPPDEPCPCPPVTGKHQFRH